MFFGPLAFQHRSKIDPNMNQNLDATFDLFLTQLASILGRFWEASWGQVCTKSIQNAIQKMITFWIALGNDFARFWWILGLTWGARSRRRKGTTNIFGTIFWLLTPRSTQEPSKSPLRAPKSQILVDFWSIFGGFLVDCWLIFDRFAGLLVCWFVAFAGFLACWLSVGQLSCPTIDPSDMNIHLPRLKIL